MKKEDLKTLRDALPKASRYVKINSKLKEGGFKQYSHEYIKNVLIGAAPNENIILCAIEVAKEHKKRMQDAINELKEK